MSFTLNRSFTFHSEITLIKGGLRFLFIILGSYFISYSVGEQMAHWLGEVLFHYLSESNLAVLIGAGLYTVLNYVGQKYIVFGEKKG